MLKKCTLAAAGFPCLVLMWRFSNSRMYPFMTSSSNHFPGSKILKFLTLSGKASMCIIGSSVEDRDFKNTALTAVMADCVSQDSGSDGSAKTEFSRLVGSAVGGTVASLALTWQQPGMAGGWPQVPVHAHQLQRQETPEAFSRRVPELSEACGNVYPEYRLKMIFPEGLPEFPLVDAENYNQEHQVHTFQQLTAYTQGVASLALTWRQPGMAGGCPQVPSARPPGGAGGGRGPYPAG